MTLDRDLTVQCEQTSAGQIRARDLFAISHHIATLALSEQYVLNAATGQCLVHGRNRQNFKEDEARAVRSFASRRLRFRFAARRPQALEMACSWVHRMILMGRGGDVDNLIHTDGQLIGKGEVSGRPAPPTLWLVTRESLRGKEAGEAVAICQVVLRCFTGWL